MSQRPLFLLGQVWSFLLLHSSLERLWGSLSMWLTVLSRLTLSEGMSHASFKCHMLAPLGAQGAFLGKERYVEVKQMGVFVGIQK